MRTASLTRFDPVREVATLQREVDRVMRDALGAPTTPATAGAWAPALDVEETQDGFVLHIELPGVAADAVEVSLEENVLTVEGERAFYDGREADGFRRVERSFGRFHRAIRLPDRVDGSSVSATHRDGVLTIDVPKAEESKPRRIAVTTG